VILDLECARSTKHSRYDETTHKDMGNRPFVQEKSYDGPSGSLVSFDQSVEIDRSDRSKQLRNVQEKTPRTVPAEGLRALAPVEDFAGQNTAGR
jgi:hypothetical protein